MQAITAKALFNSDRTVTVKLPDDVQIPDDAQKGEYEVLLVLDSNATKAMPTAEPSEKLSEEEKQKHLNEVWDALMKEVEEVPLEPTPVSSEYQQDLIEKYQKQGLEL